MEDGRQKGRWLRDGEMGTWWKESDGLSSCQREARQGWRVIAVTA